MQHTAGLHTRAAIGWETVTITIGLRALSEAEAQYLLIANEQSLLGPTRGDRWFLGSRFMIKSFNDVGPRTVNLQREIEFQPQRQKSVDNCYSPNGGCPAKFMRKKHSRD